MMSKYKFVQYEIVATDLLNIFKILLNPNTKASRSSHLEGRNCCGCWLLIEILLLSSGFLTISITTTSTSGRSGVKLLSINQSINQSKLGPFVAGLLHGVDSDVDLL